MYKVIDGHRYDTETAREMARAGKAVIYRTKAGLYFLSCAGTIKPLTLDAAQAWVEKNCSGQAYERNFGAAEGAPKKMTVALSAMDAERLAEIKKKTGRTYTELISGWIWSQKV